MQGSLNPIHAGISKTRSGRGGAGAHPFPPKNFDHTLCGKRRLIILDYLHKRFKGNSIIFAAD